MHGASRSLPICYPDGYGSWSGNRLFHSCIEAHHGVLAPEKDLERSIGSQQPDMNVGFVARLRFIEPV